MDEHGNGRPCAFLLTSSNGASELTTFLKAMREDMEKHHPTWRPSCVLIDDCDAEKKAIKCVCLMLLACEIPDVHVTDARC